MKVARESQYINHLFFVDDSLVFCKANIAESIELLKLLDIYEVASGQGINKHKIDIFFNFNTH